MPGGRVLDDQDFAAEDVALQPPQRLQFSGDVFEFLAVESERAVRRERSGRGPAGRRFGFDFRRGRGGGRVQPPHPGGGSVEEPEAQADRQPAELAVNGLDAGVQLAGVGGVDEGPVGRVGAVAEQAVLDQMDEIGEEDLPFGGAAAMAFEGAVEGVSVEGVIEDPKGGFGARNPLASAE